MEVIQRDYSYLIDRIEETLGRVRTLEKDNYEFRTTLQKTNKELELLKAYSKYRL